MATTQNPPVSVAVAGAGPAGLFAAQALLAMTCRVREEHLITLTANWQDGHG
jgi:cation diffusion facilitator CzcD-associated flavoprotein CzcO